MKNTNNIDGLFFFLSIFKKDVFCSNSKILVNDIWVTLTEKKDTAIKS